MSFRYGMTVAAGFTSGRDVNPLIGGMKNMTEKPEQKPEAKDERPQCVYCNQKYDSENVPAIQTKLPIPVSKWKLLLNEQAKVDDAEAEMERVRLNISKQLHQNARELSLQYHVGLEVENDPPRKGEEDHQGEFYFYDPMNPRQKVYLGVKLKPEQSKVLTDLWWDFGSEVEKVREARVKHFNVLVQVANACGWGFRPIITDRGSFIAPDVIEETLKKAEESWKQKRGIKE